MRIRFAVLLVVAFACRKEAVSPEKTYTMTATIVDRDARENVVTLDNKDVPGVMEPMRMDYALRGAKTDALPPNGTPVEVTLHEQDGRYWVTDVRRKK